MLYTYEKIPIDYIGTDAHVQLIMIKKAIFVVKPIR